MQAQGDDYLTPLANTPLSEQELDALLQPVWSAECPLQGVHRATAEGKDELIAEGFEQTVQLSSAGEGQPLSGTERRLVVHSLKLAQAAQAALHARLGKAQAAWAQLTVHKQGKTV